MALEDWLFAAGLMLFSIGLGMIYFPAGLIGAGVVLLVVSLAAAVRKSRG